MEQTKSSREGGTFECASINETTTKGSKNTHVTVSLYVGTCASCGLKGYFIKSENHKCRNCDPNFKYY